MGSLVPTMARGAVQLLALAGATTVGICVHYKVWRHLKDNKILKHEVERFEKRFKKFEKQMAKMRHEGKEGDLYRYKESKRQAADDQEDTMGVEEENVQEELEDENP